MYLDIHRFENKLWMIEGKKPKRNILFEPDIANAGVYRSKDNLYIFDTGATQAFSARMKRAIDEALAGGMVQKVYLLNTHSHVDHVGNNDLVQYPQAQQRFHYLDAAGIPSLKDQGAYFRRQFLSISDYYDFADGPKLPWGAAMRLLKLTRLFSDDLQFKIVLDSTLKNFGPLHLSTQTVTPFPDEYKQAFTYGGTSWTGWNLNGEVHVLEARGHSPDEVIFYVPEVKALLAGDESLEQFVCWPESSRANSIEVNKKIRGMVREGLVKVFFDSHHHDLLTESKKILHLLEHMIEGDRVFADVVFGIVRREPGLTIHQIWKRVYEHRDNPFIQERCDLEFPAMPGFLKTSITCLLLQNGSTAKGKKGQKQFYPPAEAGSFSKAAVT